MGRSAVVLGALGVMVSSRTGAEPFEGLPTGARTAAMGGACIGRGHDSSMPLMNPAGLALIERSTLSLSASLYEVTGASIPRYYADDNGVVGGSTVLGNTTVDADQRGISSARFSSYPSAFVDPGGQRQRRGLRPLTLVARLGPLSRRLSDRQLRQQRGGYGGELSDDLHR